MGQLCVGTPLTPPHPPTHPHSPSSACHQCREEGLRHRLTWCHFTGNQVESPQLPCCCVYLFSPVCVSWTQTLKVGWLSAEQRRLTASLRLLSSLCSPGTWASLVPFQVSNGTPILPTNVHQNYSINIIGEPLVPAETGNWARRGRMTPPSPPPGCWWCRAVALQASAATDETSNAAGAAQSSPTSPKKNTPTSLPTPAPAACKGRDVKMRVGSVDASGLLSPRPPPTPHPPVSRCICRTFQSIQILWCIDALMFDCMTL